MHPLKWLHLPAPLTLSPPGILWSKQSLYSNFKLPIFKITFDKGEEIGVEASHLLPYLSQFHGSNTTLLNFEGANA